MNDLIIPKQIENSLPTMAEGLRRAYDLLQQVQSFDDVERLFLMGAGLSRNTYKTYLSAIKDFYRYTEGLHPLQVRPGDIEAYFDTLVEQRCNPSTVNIRISGLKRFFAGVRNVVPAYTSPFEVMPDKLLQKLRLKTKGDSTKKALNGQETKALLKWLKHEKSIKDYALVYMLVTSGLRAAELLSLRYGDLEYDTENKSWSCLFTAKGGLNAEQELYTPAVKAAREYFKCSFKRNPQAEDFLFYTGDKRLTYHTLWQRMKQIGKQAKEIGLVRNSLEFSPHLFRRSYITRLYKSGMKLKALQQKSRHASMKTLVDHYIDDSDPATPYLDKLFEGQV